MSFDRRFTAGGGKEFWKEETFIVPEGIPLQRVKDWSKGIRWVKTAQQEDRII
jgi:hypothetical protein